MCVEFTSQCGYTIVKVVGSTRYYTVIIVGMMSYIRPLWHENVYIGHHALVCHGHIHTHTHYYTSGDRCNTVWVWVGGWSYDDTDL